MKFEDDLVEEVMAQAPDGVQFEPDEVCDALVRAVNGLWAIWPSAVQRAADRAVQRRRTQVAEPEPELDVHPGEGNA